MLLCHYAECLMLSVNYAGRRKQAHYAELCYAECHYVECRGAFFTVRF